MSWTGDMAAALPDTGDAAPATTEAAAAPDTRAREHGWGAPQAYDYEAYTKSGKNLAETQLAFIGDEPEPQLAVGGLAKGRWHSDVRTTPNPCSLITSCSRG